MGDKTDWRGRALRWGSAALAAACALAVLYYLLLPARGAFFSDTTDTLYWAQASYDSGRLVDPDFYYATLLPVGGSLLMLPFFPFFGMSMTTHLIGMALFALVLMAALWFFIRSMPMGQVAQCLTFSGVLAVLSASGKLREIMWEHVIYYSLGILFTALMLGVLFRLLFKTRKDEKGGAAATGKKAGLRQVLLLAALFLLGVAAGMDGPQVAVFCALPVALAVAAERFFNPDGPLKMKENRPAFISAGVLLLGTLAGFAVTKLAWGGVQTVYSDSYMAFSASSTWGTHLLSIGESWATLLGWTAVEGQPMVSARSLVELCRLAAAFLLLVLPLVAVFWYGKMKSRRLRILLWNHWFVSAVTLGSHIIGRTGDVNWRMTPMVASAAVVTMALLHQGWMRGGHERVLRRVVGLGIAALALFGALNVAAMVRLPPDNGMDTRFFHLAELLEEKGLTHGYSVFETAHSVTVISGEKTKVRLVDVTETGVAPRLYQTRESWYGEESADGRYYLISVDWRLEELAEEPAWQEMAQHELERFTCDEYTIVVYDTNIIQK